MDQKWTAEKKIIAPFKSWGLSITIDTNLIATDFLDVSFNLEMDSFFPYRKPNNTPFYIHSKSNHPLSITKQLPLMTNRRIFSLSCNENEFNKAKALYEHSHKKRIVWKQGPKWPFYALMLRIKL